MQPTIHRCLRTLCFSLAVAALIGAFPDGAAAATGSKEIRANLSGEQEVPPIETRASGSAVFLVHSDGTVSGTVQTQSIEGVAAHIHEGAADVNGPVAIPLTKKNDHEWATPDGAKLTPKQLDALKLGDLYVNVHTKAHPGGEIRGQLHE
jgi:hypothetical protein